MKILLELRDENVGEKSQKVEKWIERQAARCILRKDKKIALLYVQKSSYHKLPGGGVDKGESIREALHREAAEEVGSQIIIEKLIGSTIEYRSREKLHQISTCFLATETKKGMPNYTPSELSRGFKVEWHSLDNAINLLKKENPTEYNGRFVVKRDLTFLEEAKRVLSKDY